ncbi:hypothetical protein [Lactococcus lactis]|uniref:HK97 gp10 family phage protein n=1 Tax=Lactococcus lactis TaxID=1358 RepID=A0AAP3Z120_9LACT|nr:hypothetical protein [Lactococcus lactis]MDG4968249.1 hypothetical protein [Lactococcus lactis]MDG4976391.1 hypothetical protein [Lactococcus lactis]MDG5102195.1 hypothetical protein [Lactococcus lactis]
MADIFAQMLRDIDQYTKQKAQEAEGIMKDVINKKTGALSDSVEVERIEFANYKVGVNENKLINDERNAGNVNYVKFYFDGNRPHTIRAKNGGVLHWRLNGKDYYAKSVKHPGSKPHNFIQDTLDRMKK